MIFAIRDDDTAYFTKPDELEKAYDFIKKGPVSISVVPYTVSVHRDDVFPYGKNTGTCEKYFPIDRNVALVRYLREGVSNNKFEILLHGYSHEYKKINGQWLSEMKWKSIEQLTQEITEGKTFLENLLCTNINVFVAPNNHIDQKAISVISNLGMDYSGILYGGDRKISSRYLVNLWKRWAVRAIHKIPYPGVLDFGDHKELVAYTLDNIERLKKEYLICKKKNKPFVIYTHYWKINSDPEVKKMLVDIYKFLIDDGAELVRLSDCFKS